MKLQILVRLFPMGQSIKNPWGDFDQILSLSTRSLGEHVGYADSTLYFRVHKSTGNLTPMDEAEFKDECVRQALDKATVLPIMEVPHGNA